MKASEIRNASTWFLRAVIVLMGAAVLAFCVFAVAPLTRGIAAEFPLAAPLQRPMMFGLWATAIPFFVALGQALRLLRNIDRSQAFSASSAHALRVITWCALTMTGLYLVGMPAVFLMAESDDAPGLVIFGLLAACSPLVIAVFSAVLQKLVESAIAMRAENELTV